MSGRCLFGAPRLADALVRGREGFLTGDLASVPHDALADPSATAYPQARVNVTMILNVYRRSEQLVRQMAAVLRMRALPTEVWVCLFGSPFESDMRAIIGAYSGAAAARGVRLRIIASSFNFQYYGRFLVSMRARTRFVAFFDDDQIPGPRTIERLLHASESLSAPAILGTTGRRFSAPGRTGEPPPPYPRDGGKWFENDPCSRGLRAGDEKRVLSGGLEVVRVDSLNRHWFIPKSLARYLFVAPLYTLLTLEDYTLSARAWMYGHVPTFVFCPKDPQAFTRLDEGSEVSSTDYERMNEFRVAMIDRMYLSGEYNTVMCPPRVGVLLIRTTPHRDAVPRVADGATAVVALATEPRVLRACMRAPGHFCVDARGPRPRQIRTVVAALHNVLCETRPALRIDTAAVEDPFLAKLALIAAKIYIRGGGGGSGGGHDCNSRCAAAKGVAAPGTDADETVATVRGWGQKALEWVPGGQRVRVPVGVSRAESKAKPSPGALNDDNGRDDDSSPGRTTTTLPSPPTARARAPAAQPSPEKGPKRAAFGSMGMGQDRPFSWPDASGPPQAIRRYPVRGLLARTDDDV